MHAQITGTVAVAASPSTTCRFGFCRAAATHVVTTRTAIGGRVELLCAPHAQRRHELEQVLNDDLIPALCELVDDHDGSCTPSASGSGDPVLGADEPRFSLTEPGQRAPAMARLFDGGPSVAAVANRS
jgi:hypothetical protein